MKKLNIVSINTSDYFWLYVDGKKTVYSGHKIQAESIVDAINDYIEENSKGSYLHSISGVKFEEWYISDEYGEYHGDELPKDIKDIPEFAFE